MVKVFHLSLKQAKQKIEALENEVKLPQIANNKTKRKRIYHDLSQLKKAISEPQVYLVDPAQQLIKIQNEKKKRIQKKLTKKQEVMKKLKNDKRHAKKCLKCGSREHLLQQCDQNDARIGSCFKCGGTDHSHKECKYSDSYKLATCFFCGEDGHIARECQKNQKGLYTKGGSCFGCGSVRHTLKDCPTRHNKFATYSNKEEF